MSQRILLVSHEHREEIREASALTQEVAADLGLTIVHPGDDHSDLDLVLALGGDGTILKAAESAYIHDVPLLGLNFGHMGFLAEMSGDSLIEVLRASSRREYFVDPRMTLRAVVKRPDGSIHEDWALNEAIVTRTDLAHPAEFAFAVDGQVVSTYAADGIILATPTGSTAYAFSAGGPIVWPDTEAIVMAPLAAHGLFTRPLVVSPDSTLEIGVLSENWVDPVVWFDGRREVSAPAGSSIEITKGLKPLRLVRLDQTPFSKRLVSKFSLPIAGWRASGTPTE